MKLNKQKIKLTPKFLTIIAIILISTTLATIITNKDTLFKLKTLTTRKDTSQTKPNNEISRSFVAYVKEEHNTNNVNIYDFKNEQYFRVGGINNGDKGLIKSIKMGKWSPKGEYLPLLVDDVKETQLYVIFSKSKNMTFMKSFNKAFSEIPSWIRSFSKDTMFWVTDTVFNVRTPAQYLVELNGDARTIRKRGYTYYQNGNMSLIYDIKQDTSTLVELSGKNINKPTQTFRGKFIGDTNKYIVTLYSERDPLTKTDQYYVGLYDKETYKKTNSINVYSKKFNVLRDTFVHKDTGNIFIVQENPKTNHIRVLILNGENKAVYTIDKDIRDVAITQEAKVVELDTKGTLTMLDLNNNGAKSKIMVKEKVLDNNVIQISVYNGDRVLYTEKHTKPL